MKIYKVGAVAVATALSACARLKGEQEAVRRAMITKNCGN